jgi:geranylgeranyl diphosphate synthase type II
MTSAEYKLALEAALGRWFDIAEKEAPSKEGRQLTQRMRTLIARGGKRARPGLLHMAYLAYGGNDTKKLGALVDVGLALELHHQALLAHDDIIDNDHVRYNGPNIAGYYLQDNPPTSPEIASAMALLAGDLLLTYSDQVILTSSHFTNSEKVTLMHLINKANIEVGFGQQLDSINLNPDSSPDIGQHLLLINSLKSASYTTRLPMACAATLLKLPAKEQQCIAEFADAFGVLFQLADDYSDYFDNQSVFNNRPKYRDFRQGKITYPLYSALQLAQGEQYAFIRTRLGEKDLPDKDMARVIVIMDVCGAREASRKQYMQFHEKTLRLLNKLDLGNEQKQQFADLIAGYQV